MSEEETQTCSNCKKQIPASKIDLHENYCHRNVKKCPKCDEMIDKNEMEEHEAEMHKMMPCEHCNFQFEASKLKEHVSSCTEKPRNCEFCETKVVGSDYAAHVKHCGSRTRKCELCQKNIPLRDFTFHEEHCTDIVDQYPSLDQPKFPSQPALQRKPEAPKPSVSYGSEWTSNSSMNKPAPAPAQVKPKAAVPGNFATGPAQPAPQPKPAQNTGPTNYFPPKTTIPMPAPPAKKEEPKPAVTKPVTTSTATKFHSTNTKPSASTKPPAPGPGDMHVHGRGCNCGQDHKPPVPTVQKPLVPAKPVKPPVEEEKKQAPAPVKKPEPKAAPKPAPEFIPPEDEFDDEAMARKIQEEFDLQLAQEMHGEKPIRVSNTATARDEELARQIYSELHKNEPAGIASVNPPNRQPPSNPGSNNQRPAQPTNPRPQPSEPSRISQNTRPIVPREPDLHGIPGGPDWGGGFDDRPMSASGADAELQRAIEESLRHQSKGPAMPSKPEPKKTTTTTTSTTGSRRR